MNFSLWFLILKLLLSFDHIFFSFPRFPPFPSQIYFLIKVLSLRFIYSSYIIDTDSSYDYYFLLAFLSFFFVSTNHWTDQEIKMLIIVFLEYTFCPKVGKIYIYSTIQLILKLAKSFLKKNHLCNLYTYGSPSLSQRQIVSSPATVVTSSLPLYFFTSALNVKPPS